VFAEQCAEYLESARAERAGAGYDTGDNLASEPSSQKTKREAEPRLVADPESAKPEISFDTTGWADGQDADPPAPAEVAEYVNTHGSVLDIGRAPIRRADPPAEAIAEPTSAGWAVTRQPESVFEPTPIQ